MTWYWLCNNRCVDTLKPVTCISTPLFLLQTLRECLAACNGVEVTTQGDSFFVVFTSIGDAVQWCMLVQRRLLSTDWPSAVYRLPACQREYNQYGELSFSGPRVRMGIHWATAGSFACRRDAEGSLAFHGAAYIFTDALADAGAGGQVLLSHPAWTRLQVEGCPAAGFPVVHQLGLFQLHGPFSPEWVYQVHSLLGHPMHREFRHAGGEALRKATQLQQGRHLFVTTPPAPCSEDQVGCWCGCRDVCCVAH